MAGPDFVLMIQQAQVLSLNKYRYPQNLNASQIFLSVAATFYFDLHEVDLFVASAFHLVNVKESRLLLFVVVIDIFV